MEHSIIERSFHAVGIALGVAGGIILVVTVAYFSGMLAVLGMGFISLVLVIAAAALGVLRAVVDPVHGVLRGFAVGLVLGAIIALPIAWNWTTMVVRW